MILDDRLDDIGIEVKIDMQIHFGNWFIKFINNLIFTSTEQKDRSITGDAFLAPLLFSSVEVRLNNL